MGDELEYVKQAIDSHKICGDGALTKQCECLAGRAFPRPEGAADYQRHHCVDMAMLLCDIQPGDEVILPSFTFSSTATSAVLAGVKLVFVDVRPDTMNIDEKKSSRLSPTRPRSSWPSTTPVFACEMDTIMDIARRHNLKVVEDAAQGRYEQLQGQGAGHHR